MSEYKPPFHTTDNMISLIADDSAPAVSAYLTGMSWSTWPLRRHWCRGISGIFSPGISSLNFIR